MKHFLLLVALLALVGCTPTKLVPIIVPIIVPPLPALVVRCPSPDAFAYSIINVGNSLQSVQDSGSGPCLYSSSILGAAQNPSIIEAAFAEAVRTYPISLGAAPVEIFDKMPIVVRFSQYMDNGKCMAVLPEDWPTLDYALTTFGQKYAYQGHMCTHGWTQVPKYPIVITVPYNATATGSWLDYEMLNALCRTVNTYEACSAAGIY